MTLGMCLQKANQALDDLQHGRFSGAAVLVPLAPVRPGSARGRDGIAIRSLSQPAAVASVGSPAWAHLIARCGRLGQPDRDSCDCDAADHPSRLRRPRRRVLSDHPVALRGHHSLPHCAGRPAISG